MSEITKELVKIPARVGGSSMIGVRLTDFPKDYGNYFTYKSGERSVNMWAENLEHLVESKILHDGMIEGILYTVDDKRWFLATDKRVNHGYFSKLCFTGSLAPPEEIVHDMKLELIELIFERLGFNK